MTFTQTMHCIWSCRTGHGNYVIQKFGKNDWCWYVATKTDAVSVGSYDEAVKACEKHLEGATNGTC